MNRCRDCIHWRTIHEAIGKDGRCLRNNWTVDPSGTCPQFYPGPPAAACGGCLYFTEPPAGRYVGKCWHPCHRDAPVAPHETCSRHASRPAPGAFFMRMCRTVQ